MPKAAQCLSSWPHRIVMCLRCFSLIQTVEWTSPTVIQSLSQCGKWSCRYACRARAGSACLLWVKPWLARDHLACALCVQLPGLCSNAVHNWCPHGQTIYLNVIAPHNCLISSTVVLILPQPYGNLIAKAVGQITLNTSLIPATFTVYSEQRTH